MIVSPIMGQEQKESKSINYKRPIFGLNVDMGYSYNIFSRSGFNVGISPEFYVGIKHKVYFYLQFSLGYQYYTYRDPEDLFLIMPAVSTFYFGAYIGMGGYIREANDYDPWSIIMNGAVGGSLLFRPIEKGYGYNGTSTELYGEGAVAYLDILFRKHINEDYAIQFGPALLVNFMIPSITVDVIFKLGLAF